MSTAMHIFLNSATAATNPFKKPASYIITQGPFVVKEAEADLEHSYYVHICNKLFKEEYI